MQHFVIGETRDTAAARSTCPTCGACDSSSNSGVKQHHAVNRRDAARIDRYLLYILQPIACSSCQAFDGTSSCLHPSGVHTSSADNSAGDTQS